MINSVYKVPIIKKEKIEDAFAKPTLAICVGPCGSGKTVLLGNLLAHLDKNHDFDEALFVTGNGRDTFLKSLEMPVTSNPADLSRWITAVSQESDEPKYNLLVLDDTMGNPDFSLFSNRSQFTKFILSHRHLGAIEKNGKKQGGTWVVMTAQRWQGSFSISVKDQMNMLFLFNPRSSAEKKVILKLGDDDIKMRKAMDLLDRETQKNPHEFLYINRRMRPNGYFLGFQNELKLDV